MTIWCTHNKHMNIQSVCGYVRGWFPVVLGGSIRTVRAASSAARALARKTAWSWRRSWVTRFAMGRKIERNVNVD